jgi:hypothetical protein
MKIQVRGLAIALAIAGPLAAAATAKSSAAPINGRSIKAAVPAVTTDVRYRAYRDNPYPSDWGYATYKNYRYSDYSTYSRSYASHCRQRWAYYDAASGKYMGDDGLWRLCS